MLRYKDSIYKGLYENATVLFPNLTIQTFCGGGGGGIKLIYPGAVLYSLLFACSSGRFNAISASYRYLKHPKHRWFYEMGRLRLDYII